MTDSNVDLFSALQAISQLTRSPDQEDEGRERLIRLLDQYGGGSPEQPIVDALCARFGLYPYMSQAATDDSAMNLAIEFHSPAALAEEDFTLHAMQQVIFQRLMDGESLILSAPTSFGKSAIVDALVASNKWSQIVLIVPTIALIDETRRRLARFRSAYTLVTHPSQAPGERNIYVMTQERFLELDETPPAEFFVIDEFYKLGTITKGSSRQALLNIAWSRLRATGAQYYLIGPNVQQLSPEIGVDLRESLVITDFKTVAVDISDRSDVEDPRSDMLSLVATELSGSTLIFTSAPQRAEELSADLANQLAPLQAGAMAAEVADWLAASFHPNWVVARSLQQGVGVHSGPLPRSVQRIMIRMFNEALISTLFCTTTLIEGVNTAAKNVVIYDKKINGQLLDFFTFSNIRGRAGRAFRHFVGNVITYAPLPDPSDTEIDIPIESQSKTASLATLIQLSDGELSEEARERLQEIFDQQDLSVATIKRNRGLSPNLQVKLARSLRETERVDLERLSWSGRPTNEEYRFTLQVAFDHLLEPIQRKGMNFNMLWGRLNAVRANASNFPEMVRQQQSYARPEQSEDDIIRELFTFQRNWLGFTVPSMLLGLQNLQSEILPQLNIAPGNYEYVLREIEGLFLPPGIADLDEYGLPAPLAMKLLGIGLAGDDVPALLGSLREMSVDKVILTQLSKVERWILSDVIEGLGGA